MSLLESDVATVFPEETFTDSRGNTVKRPSSQGVEVRCLITANSSIRRATGTNEAATVAGGFSFASRSAPLGAWSRVIWRGQSFTVASGPMAVGPIGSTVHHIEALLIEER